MWIRTSKGDLVNLAQCQRITIESPIDSDGGDYYVVLYFDENYATLVTGSKEFCEAYIDRLNMQLALLEMTIVV